MNQIPLSEKKNKSALAMQSHWVSKVYIFSMMFRSFDFETKSKKLKSFFRSRI